MNLSESGYQRQGFESVNVMNLSCEAARQIVLQLSDSETRSCTDVLIS